MRGIRRAIATTAAAVCAIGMAIALGGCVDSSRPTAGAPDPGLRGEWVLASGSDSFGPMKLLGQDITLSISAASAATGRSSCSNYTVTIYGPQRDLWITTSAPHSYACATADQNVIQLEYLADLARVQHASVTEGGLTLAGQGVELSFVRAATVSTTKLIGESWELKTAGTIKLHEAFRFQLETGATLDFTSASIVTVVTRCGNFSGQVTRQADQLVLATATGFRDTDCATAGDQPNKDIMAVLGGGFTYSLSSNTLTLTSTRAGLILGFERKGTP
jgi:heat shock protein HslJ